MKRLLSYAVVPVVALSLASCGAESSSKPEEAAASDNKTVTVPDTTGDSAPAAKRAILAAGPDLTVQFAEAPDDPGSCTVSDQDGTGEVAADATVTLTLECEVEVPDVTGEPADDAQASIETVGDLTAAFDDEPDDPSACSVASQDPKGGATVSPDTEVALTLTCGVEVPDVTGQDAATAKSEIEDSGDLTASYDTEPDDPSACTVTGQDPEGGASVDSGTDVTLTLECETAEGGGEESSSCEPGYDPCLKADSSDYDCEGGSGDGPDYTGPVTVTGDDRFDLDRDGDGSGCDE